MILFVHLIVTVTTGKTGRTPLRRCGVRAGPASAVRPQSRPQVCAYTAHPDRIIAGLVYTFHAPAKCSPFRHRSEALYTAALPPCAEETKIPHVVFAPARVPAW